MRNKKTLEKWAMKILEFMAKGILLLTFLLVINLAMYGIALDESINRIFQPLVISMIGELTEFWLIIMTGYIASVTILFAVIIVTSVILFVIKVIERYHRRKTR